MQLLNNCMSEMEKAQPSFFQSLAICAMLHMIFTQNCKQQIIRCSESVKRRPQNVSALQDFRISQQSSCQKNFSMEHFFQMRRIQEPTEPFGKNIQMLAEGCVRCESLRNWHPFLVAPHLSLLGPGDLLGNRVWNCGLVKISPSREP